MFTIEDGNTEYDIILSWDHNVDEEEVVAALAEEAYENSTAQGMGALHFQSGGMSKEMLDDIIDYYRKFDRLYLDYLAGRCCKVDAEMVEKKALRLRAGLWNRDHTLSAEELLERVVERLEGETTTTEATDVREILEQSIQTVSGNIGGTIEEKGEVTVMTLPENPSLNFAKRAEKQADNLVLVDEKYLVNTNALHDIDLDQEFEDERTQTLAAAARKAIERS